MSEITTEQAAHELKRRGRDTVTGQKLPGKKLRQTDGRMKTTPEAKAAATALLVEIANPAPVNAPEPARMSTPVFEIPDGYAVEWQDDIPVLVAA